MYYKIVIWFFYLIFVILTFTVSNVNKNIYLYIVKISSLLLLGLCSTGLVMRNICYKSTRQPFIPPGVIYDRNQLVLAYTYTDSTITLNYNKLCSHYKDHNAIPLIPVIFKDVSHMKSQVVKNKITLNYRDNHFRTWIRKLPSYTFSISEKLCRKYTLDNLTTSLGYCDIHSGKVQGLEKMALKKNVYSSIDLKLQTLLAHSINKCKLNGEVVWGIIMNLDGEIEALHHTKAPNIFTKNIKINMNPVFSAVYEFGSVSKILTLWSALHNKIYDETSLLPNPHTIKIDNRVIENPVNYKKKEVTLYEVIRRSLNTPIIHLCYKLKYQFLTTLNNMHLFNSIDLGGIITPRGLLPKVIRLCDIVTMSFGYSYSTNPINFLRVICAIFNKGKLYEPSILKGGAKLLAHLDKGVCERVTKILQIANNKHFLGKLMCPHKTGTVIVQKKPNKLYNTFAVVGITDSDNKIVKVMLLGNIKSTQRSLHIKNLASEILRTMNIKF